MGFFQYQTRLRGIKRMKGSVSQVTVVAGRWEADKVEDLQTTNLTHQTGITYSKCKLIFSIFL